MFFIAYSLYQLFEVQIDKLLANETFREISVAGLVALVTVIGYAIYENWEKKEDDGDIREGS
jgi:preprotein translocase subunit SecF